MPYNPNSRDSKELILQLKQIRVEKGLTLQTISDKMDEAGCHIGFSTIKRVFGPNSESMHFSYDNTLDPIAEVLFKLYDDEGDAEAKALKADLAIKETIIKNLEREHIALLREQIDLKDARIDRLMTRVDEVLASNRELLVQLQKLLEKL